MLAIKSRELMCDVQLLPSRFSDNSYYTYVVTVVLRFKHFATVAIFMLLHRVAEFRDIQFSNEDIFILSVFIYQRDLLVPCDFPVNSKKNI